MKHTKAPETFNAEDRKIYHFVVSGGTQTVFLCSETDKNVLFELDYKNAYRMFDALEAALDYLDRGEE